MPNYPALEHHKIPHKIEFSDRFVRFLMRIAEHKPFLNEMAGSTVSHQLLRQARVKAITYSNQIEGNTLSEKEVEQLLKGKLKKEPDQETKEVLNYEAAHNYAERLATDERPLTIRDLCDLQKLITKDLIEKTQWGVIRTVGASIGNPTTGKVLDTCPEPHELPALMNDLWQWLKDTEGTNPFARAFAFHQMSVVIHPFRDGNGRTLRLFQHLLLLRSQEVIARYIPSETALMKNRDRYYLTIRESKSMGSLSPMLEFLAECFAIAAEETTVEARKLYEATVKKSGAVRRKEVLVFAKKNPGFKLRDISNAQPETNIRTLQRDLDSLIAEKKLRVEGRLKGTRYFTHDGKAKKTKKSARSVRGRKVAKKKASR